MSYTPTNWQTGEVITAEKLNKMDNGWGIQSTQLFSETVTTVSAEGFVSGALSYSLPINSDTITVTFNGTDYVCSRITMDHVNYYGGFSEQGPDFSAYPFAIMSGELNLLFTENTGTYTVAVTGDTIVVSKDFEIATARAHDFEILLGVTTWLEANKALRAGKNVYLWNTLSQPFVDKALFLTSTYTNDNKYLLCGIHFVYLPSKTEYLSEIHLGADTEDGVLYLA